MLNYYSSNYNQIQKPYNQINIEKITKQINNNRERASSINIEKLKIKGKITNSISKKNTTTKTISVNKQLQYRKKSQNHSYYLQDYNNFFDYYNNLHHLLLHYIDLTITQIIIPIKYQKIQVLMV